MRQPCNWLSRLNHWRSLDCKILLAASVSFVAEPFESQMHLLLDLKMVRPSFIILEASSVTFGCEMLIGMTLPVEAKRCTAYLAEGCFVCELGKDVIWIDMRVFREERTVGSVGHSLIL